MSQVPVSERASSVDLDLDQSPTERALGVQWNVEDDAFRFHGGTVRGGGGGTEEPSCHKGFSV